MFPLLCAKYLYVVYNKYVNLNVHDFVLQQMDSVCFASSEGCAIISFL